MRQQHLQQSDSSVSSDDDEISKSESVQQEELIQQEEQRIKQQLKHMPYELILNQRKAIQQSNRVEHGSNKTPKIPRPKGKLPKAKLIQKAKKQKNEAVEVGIKEKTRKKEVIIFEQKRKLGIDPRFQSFAGHYNQDLAMKSYGFIPKLQKQEINELKSKLKSKSKKFKLNQHQRDILMKQYNKVTSDFKRAELLELEKQTKREFKQKNGENYYLKKNQFRQEFEKKKFQGLSDSNKEKKLHQKEIQIQRGHMNERRKTLHMKPRKH